jgi:hypothetical protein
MSFDNKNDGQPIVNVHKRTTKVNIWMVVAVVVFLAIGVVAAVMFVRDHSG